MGESFEWYGLKVICVVEFVWEDVELLFLRFVLRKDKIVW